MVASLQDAKLAASVQEEDAWIKQQQQQQQPNGISEGNTGAASDGSWHFVCECFFMTAKALHLGIIKMIDDVTDGRMYWDQIRYAEAIQQAEQAAAR